MATTSNEPKITCSNNHPVSRRRLNTALRFRQQPTCDECGSTRLTFHGTYELRDGGRRMIWTDDSNNGRAAGRKKKRGR